MPFGFGRVGGRIGRDAVDESGLWLDIPEGVSVPVVGFFQGPGGRIEGRDADLPKLGVKSAVPRAGKGPSRPDLPPARPVGRPETQAAQRPAVAPARVRVPVADWEVPEGAEVIEPEL